MNWFSDLVAGLTPLPVRSKCDKVSFFICSVMVNPPKNIKQTKFKEKENLIKFNSFQFVKGEK